MELNTYRKHLIRSGTTIIEALARLDILARDAILFIVDEDEKLIGSLTDGDVRRGLLKGYNVEQAVDDIIQPSPKFIRKGVTDIYKIIDFRENNFKIIPITNRQGHVVNVINFREQRSYLPVDVVIMAGGRGERLRPLTDTTPKPLLKIGDKPILEHNLDRLALFGIDDFWISVKYLSEQIEEYFGNGSDRNVSIKYVHEDDPLGTIGAVSKIQDFQHEYIMVINSDLLTNMNYEHFFLDFLKQEAEFAAVTIPYKVSVPYAVFETSNGQIINFKEKPTYTYYSNGGIYLMKRSCLDFIPKNTFYNATDFMEDMIKHNKKVISYASQDYWLDIGKPEDMERAQKDISRLKMD